MQTVINMDTFYGPLSVRINGVWLYFFLLHFLTLQSPDEHNPVHYNCKSLDEYNLVHHNCCTVQLG